MLLCCFRDNDSDKEEVRPSRPSKGHKGRNGKRAVTNPGSTRDSSVSRISACNEGGVILAPITFHPAPTTIEPRSILPPPYNRSTSVCSTLTNSEQPSLSRQSSTQSNSHLSLVRPQSRDGVDKRRDKERAPLSKEAKRLMKQRSQESFVHQQQQPFHQQPNQSYIDRSQTVNNSQSISSIPFIDQSPPIAKTGPQDDESRKGSVSINSTSPLRQFAEEKRRRSNTSTLSTPNLPTVSPTHQNSVVPLQPLTAPQKPFQGSSTQLSKIEEKIQGRGMCRSSASYGIQQMLQEQISQEENNAKAALEKELARVVAAYEERLNGMKLEQNLQIQQILREKNTAINNAKNTFESELQRKTAEIEANIRNKLAAELQTERALHTAELERLRENYENALSDAELRHRDAIEHLQDRDQNWQAEKQDVLGEIQRLKEEASRFIAILSQEEEYEKSDQQLSPTKRQSLTKEVESLQLVVEMRSTEVRQLREERAKLLEQLSSLESTRNMLEKMSARVEDLQAQLEVKSVTERQLSLEKSQLENSYETESKNKARMSMQVEELQWRIKHNLELPAAKIFTPDSPMSMDDSQWNEISGPTSLTTNQIHSYDEVVTRKHKSENSTPRKDYYFSNRTTYNYDVWAKGDCKKDPKSFCLSSPKKTMNNNKPDSPVTTPMTAQNISNNNNQFISGDVTKVDGREKRDQSTEKHLLVDEDDRKVILSEADSLEEIAVAEEPGVKGDVSLLKQVPHFTEEEYDEGLGDINHGSEASTSPQPPAILSTITTNNINNNNSPDEEFLQNQPNDVRRHSGHPKSNDVTRHSGQEIETRGKEETCDKKTLLGSPCDERVPSRIPFQLQTNL